MATTKSVDDYIASLDDWRGEVVAAIRDVVLSAAPEARESIKWAQPVYEVDGPFAYVKAFPRSVNFGFWRGTDLDDPDGRLDGDGDRMRHVKIASLADVDALRFAAWTREAVALNREKGDPSKRG